MMTTSKKSQIKREKYHFFSQIHDIYIYISYKENKFLGPCCEFDEAISISNKNKYKE